MNGSALVALLRPRQWIKSLLVLAPLILSGNAFSTELLARALGAAGAVTLAMAGTYALNDVWDVAADRAHPLKRNRPVAAKQVTPRAATTIGLLCVAGGLLSAWLLSPLVAMVTGVLVLSSLAYTAGLKRVAGLELVLVALNYVFRALIGALAILVPPSPWLYLGTFFAALCIITIKRSGESRIRTTVRAVAQARAAYTSDALTLLTHGTFAATLVTAGLYTVTAHDGKLLPLFPLAALLVIRFTLRSSDETAAQEPETFYRDPVLLISTIILILVAGWLLR